MFDRQPVQPSRTGRAFKLAAVGLLLFLSAIALFSLFNRQGAADHIHYAEGALTDNRPRAAIGHLDRAQGMSPPPDLLHRILDLRSLAQERVGNLEFAERDLVHLLEVTREPRRRTELVIRLAGRILLPRAARAQEQGRLDRALTLAVRAHDLVQPEKSSPQDSLRLAALETSGRCGQRAYQITVRKAQAGLDVPLTPKVLARAHELILKLVFMPRKNLPYRLTAAELKELLTRADLPAVRIHRLEEEIGRAREWVAAAFRDYGLALRPREGFAAFQGVSGLLARGGRSDEAAMISRLMLSAGDSPYLGRAAERLAGIHLEAGRKGEAIRVLEGWLEGNRPKDLLDEYGWLPEQAQDAMALLLDLYATAEDKDGFCRLVSLVWPHWEKHRGRLRAYWDFYTGMSLRFWEKDLDQMEEKLARFAKTHHWPGQEPIDRFVLAQRTRFHSFRDRGDSEKAHAVLREWIEKRPRESGPLILQAQVFREEGKEAEARIALKRAYRIGWDEKVLRLLWEARDRMLSAQGRDPALVGARLVRQGNVFSSSLSNQHLHLGLARWFRERGMAKAALYHAQAAHLYYPHSIRVSVLLNTIRLESGRLAEARSALENLRQNHPEEPQVLELLGRVYRKLELEDPSLRRDLVLHGRGPEGFRLVVEGLMDRLQWTQALAVAERAVARFPGPEPWFHFAAGQCCRALGRAEEAHTHYRKVPPASRLRPEAVMGSIMALAPGGDVPRLEGLIGPFLQPDSNPDRVLELARFLGRQGLFAPAVKLTEGLARREDYRDKGSLFTYLAALRQKCGRSRPAIEAAEAALSFEDGQGALSFLVAAYLAAGDTAQAAEVFDHSGPKLFSPRDRALLAVLLDRPAPATFPGPSPASATPLERAETRALALLAGKEEPSIPSTGYDGLDKLTSRFPHRLLTILFLLRREGFALEAHQLAGRLEVEEKSPLRSWILHLQGKASFAAGIFHAGIAETAQAIQADPANLPAWVILCREGLARAEKWPLERKIVLLQEGMFPLWRLTWFTDRGIRPFLPTDWRFLAAYSRMLADTITGYARNLGKAGVADIARAGERIAALFRQTARLYNLQGARLPDEQEIASLIAENKLALACHSLSMAYFNSRGVEQARLGDSFFRLVRQVPELTDMARQFARQILPAHRPPFGPALHYLLATDGVPLDRAIRERRQELLAHLARAVASPLDSVDFHWGGVTARLLASLEPARARDGALQMLGRCPSYWPAWEALGLAQAELGREREAEEIFTRLDLYRGRSPIPLGKVLYLGRRDLQGMPGKQVFPNPQDDRTRVAAALIELRAGRMGAAANFLDSLEEPDPDALFFGAYTDIFHDPPRRREARARLDLLLTRWPDHRLSRHADLVLRMLPE